MCLVSLEGCSVGDMQKVAEGTGLNLDWLDNKNPTKSLRQALRQSLAGKNMTNVAGLTGGWAFVWVCQGPATAALHL